MLLFSFPWLRRQVTNQECEPSGYRYNICTDAALFYVYVDGEKYREPNTENRVNIFYRAYRLLSYLYLSGCRLMWLNRIVFIILIALFGKNHST